MVQGDWPLLIPPLLALLDDETTAFKVKGCELLTHFLAITPPSVLQRTGLGQVFHEVLMPCLSYLPILTPEGESLFLLRVVYPALIILTRVRFSEHADRRQKMHTLDKILRLGVIKGYAHAGENVKIAELLVQKMEDLVKEMGIMSVKHMKVWSEAVKSINCLNLNLQRILFHYFPASCLRRLLSPIPRYSWQQTRHCKP